MSEIMLEKRQRSLLSPNFTCRSRYIQEIRGQLAIVSMIRAQAFTFSVATLVDTSFLLP
ncbi:hypothetical protein [Paenibacillus thalictri]|uniref:hypothetical protein n=1 Tax=Paenibacillus thalictri TaxID=2527873 RepID=UPI0013EF1C28|nr:hypothetical protein [Paenibacillus thalictri]